jgi:CHAT domain-containing protein
VVRGKRPALPPLAVPPSDPVAPVAAKDDRPYAHPSFWAAFVLLGDGD